MGPLLAAHRGAVLGFFLTLLYAEFTHAVYRSAALAHFAIDAIVVLRRTLRDEGFPADLVCAVAF